MCCFEGESLGTLLLPGVALRCIYLYSGGARAPFATLVKSSDCKDDHKVAETSLSPGEILLAAWYWLRFVVMSQSLSMQNTRAGAVDVKRLRTQDIKAFVLFNILDTYSLPHSPPGYVMSTRSQLLLLIGELAADPERFVSF